MSKKEEKVKNNKVVFNKIEYHKHPIIKTHASSQIGQNLDIKKQSIIMGDEFEDGCWYFKNLRSFDFINACHKGLIPKNKK